MNDNQNKWESTKLQCFEICQQKEYMDINEVIGKIKELENLDRYAYILHDKDEGVKPHYHILIRMNNAYTVKFICSRTGVKPNCIERIHTTFPNALLYLIHQTPKALNKYQYGEDEVKANYDIKQDLVEAKNKRMIEKRKTDIIERLTIGDLKKYQLDSYFEEHNIPLVYRVKWKLDIDNAVKIYNETQSFKTDRHMDVIYIFGNSGTGKTTYCKDFAEKQNKQLYISSSNIDDLFSAYQQQEIVVIDDIEKGISYGKVLKLLDNNTSSPVKSRYSDKSLSSCETMFITSTKDIDEIFDYGNNFEMKQIYRRIQIKMYCDKEKIKIYRYNSEINKYKQVIVIKNPLNEYLKNHKDTCTSSTDEVIEFIKDNYVV